MKTFLPEGKWAYKYDKCKECGTTERRHVAFGLCANCYYSQKTRLEQNNRTAKTSYYKRLYGKHADLIRKLNELKSELLKCN